MDFLRQLLGEAERASNAPSTAHIALRLGLALAMGLVVAGLYLASRPVQERTRGFAQTLLLIAPLIAMVSMAVGTNVAAAFTLVGTLAIVRFRTPVRDARDTVFVIFAVAEGMAMGNFEIEVAAIGAAIIAATLAGARAVRAARSSSEAATFTVRLTLSPPAADLSAIAARLSASCAAVEVLRQQLRGSPVEQVLLYRLDGFDPVAIPALQRALLEQPDVKALDFELREAEGP